MSGAQEAATLRDVAWFLLSCSGITIVVLVCHSIWRVRAVARRAEAMQAAQWTLAMTAGNGDWTSGLGAGFTSLPLVDRAQVLIAGALRIDGPGLRAVREIADEAGVLRWARRRLTSRRWQRRLVGARTLSALRISSPHTIRLTATAMPMSARWRCRGSRPRRLCARPSSR